MAIQLKKDGPADLSRVNVHEPLDRDYWCQEFGCTEFYLRVAVDAVGSRAESVRAYLPSKPRG